MPQQKRLLVVDDDEMNRDMLGRRLFRVGYDVRLAASGREALDILTREHIDLVLLDLMMPDMGGLEVLNQIRRIRPSAEFPVIMVTANHESSGVVAALRSGANDYLTKPLDFPLAESRIEAGLALAGNSQDCHRQVELYRLASVACEEGLWDWDLVNRTMVYSPRWKAVLGYRESELSCDPEEWFSRIHPDDLRRVKNQIRDHLQNSTDLLLSEYRLRHKDGTWRWVENRGSAVRDTSGMAVRMAGSHSDITSRKTIDSLTSLYNRLWLDMELRAIDPGQLDTALLLFSLDGFHRLEASLPEGETGPFLSSLAGRMRAVLERSSMAGRAALIRVADHEFAVLLRRTSIPQEAQTLALQIQEALNEPLERNGERLMARASSGIALASPGEPANMLLLNAQAAVRHARKQGERGLEVFERSMREHDLEEMRIEADLRRSLEQEAFVVYYQPKVSIEDGVIRGFEALLRWRRSAGGLVSPEHFIPLAERTGLIIPIGRQVMERACRDTAELRRQYPDVTVSVNVSGHQFEDPRLVEMVEQSLADAGLPPAALRLEITETAVMRNPDTALVMLKRFQQLGVGLKLDDFGTGYSSLTYLHSFPFHTLKIDRSFVMRLPASESVAIVRAVLSLARSLQMNVVAEGVETRRQAELLRVMGCEYGQGYWYSRPVDLPTLRELLAVGSLPLPALSPQPETVPSPHDSERVVA